MKAHEIFRDLLDGAINIIENTCDVLIAGDENKEVKKIGVCFKLTAELIHRAMAQGIDLIITHEPTFSRGDRREDAAYVDLKKWALLDESGITVYRFHDHATTAKQIISTTDLSKPLICRSKRSIQEKALASAAMR